MDGHSYGNENDYIYPDTGDYNIGNNELVFKFPPHDNYEGVDRDGLISQAVLSISDIVYTNGGRRTRVAIATLVSPSC
jgi:hypothetical protein